LENATRAKFTASNALKKEKVKNYKFITPLPNKSYPEASHQ